MVVKYPYMKHYYLMFFPTKEQANKTRLAPQKLDDWVDPRSGDKRTIVARFQRSYDDRAAGRFRSHFYKAIEDHLSTNPLFKDKKTTLSMPNQTLVVDIDEDPYELITMPKVMGKVTCRVNPYWANFEHLGITKAEAEVLIDRAIAQASASLE